MSFWKVPFNLNSFEWKTRVMFCQLLKEGNSFLFYSFSLATFSRIYLEREGENKALVKGCIWMWHLNTVSLSLRLYDW